jgi:carbamoyl-phosphate synthase large subunit
MGTDTTFIAALKKAFIASGVRPPLKNLPILFSVTDRDKREASAFAQKMYDIGFKIACTDDTHEYFISACIECALVPKSEVLKVLKEKKVSMVINTPTRGKQPTRLGFSLRRTAMEFNVPCITSIDTLNALLSVMTARKIEEHYIPLGEYRKI